MIRDQEILELKSQIKKLKLFTGVITILLTSLLFLSFKTYWDKQAHFAELTVGTLNIAGPDSVKRMILTHQIGDAPWNGEKIKRNVPANMAGIIYCNPNGDEIGGKGWSGDEVSSFAINAFDYSGIPLEAIGFNRIQNDKSQSAQFIVMDNPRGDISLNKDKLVEEINSASPGSEVNKLKSQMINRVTLGVQDHVASLLISDQNGNPRIKLTVDEDDNARILVLNENGETIASLPNKNQHAE